jgi:hypothetical protein
MRFNTLMGCAAFGLSLFASTVIFQVTKTGNVTDYLIRGNGRYFVYSPIGALMTISIIAQTTLEKLNILQTSDAETNRLTALIIGSLSTYAIHSMAERGNNVAAYVIVSLTILQIVFGFFFGPYTLLRNYSQDSSVIAI